MKVSWDDVKQAAAARVDRHLTVSLVQCFLSGVGLELLVPILEMLGGDYPAVGAPNGKRRRFANTEANRTLLERLKELGTVNTIIPDGADLRVNMKKR